MAKNSAEIVVDAVVETASVDLVEEVATSGVNLKVVAVGFVATAVLAAGVYAIVRWRSKNRNVEVQESVIDVEVSA